MTKSKEPGTVGFSMNTLALPTAVHAHKPHWWEPLKIRHRRLAARVFRARVRNRDFTIISNDCFGGMIYEELGFRYHSPTVGLFLVPEDYMRFLRRLRWHCEQPLSFRDKSQHEAINTWREQIQREYPIGVLSEDVEVQFLHYASQAEAEAKWARRVQRIDWGNLLVKTCWHDEPRMAAWLAEFDAMPFPRKLALVPNGRKYSSAVSLPRYTTDGSWQHLLAHRAFDLAEWLNTGTIRRKAWLRLLNWMLYSRF